MITRADLELRFGAARIEELEAGREGAVSAAIDDSVARVEVTLKGVAWPQAVQRVACDMALYYLAGQEGQATEAMEKNYQSALRFLESLANGEMSLGNGRPVVVANFPTSQLNMEQFGQ